ncbi:MAG: SET domain-containing protein-lysine N-methyltransferase [Myxococcaceae bacterium]|nr:SET domain-containing protein-lysine N-methyltransferase [Myxococcaceae bacterium]
MSTHAESERTTENLLRWIEQGGAQLSKFHVVSLGGGERGIRAREDIAPQEKLMRIPRRFALTVDDVRSSDIGRLLEAHARFDDERTYLFAFLLQERERGEASFWKPYVDSLPTSFPTLPYSFNERECSLLKGSFLKEMIDAQRETLKIRYAHLCEAVPGFSRFSQEDFVWAHHAVLSRTFAIKQNGEMAACLVPLADMINDGRPWDTHWGLSEDGTHFELRSLSPVPQGRELLTSYGNKSNFRLLLQYGFVHEQNEHNDVSLLFNLPAEDPFAAEKQQLLGFGNPLEMRTFKLMLKFDTEMLKDMFSFLRVVHAEGEEMALLKAAPDPRSRSRAILSTKNEQKLIPAFVAACEERLKAYETSVEEDEKLLEEGKLSTNERNCVVMRLGEKRIFQTYARSYADMARSGFLPTWLG